MRIPVPPLAEQQRIAAVLDALDDKIESNRRLARLLEQLAQAEFRARFVDFVGTDELQESVLGRIPKGWRVGSLGDVLVSRVHRVKPSDETRQLRYVPIDCIATRSLLLAQSRVGEEARSSLIRFSAGDLLFGAMRPYFHRVCIAPFDGTTRTTAFVLQPASDDVYSFALLRLYQPDTIEYASRTAQGSTIPYAKWDGSLAAMPVVVPPLRHTREFHEVVRPLLRGIVNTFFEQETLTDLRETLLPKLISGRIGVLETADPDEVIQPLITEAAR